MRDTKYRMLNPKTGEWTVDFYDNGRLCEAHEVDLQKSHIARHYASYGLILEDLELLLKWAGKYKESVNAFEIEHHEDTDVIAFGQVPNDKSDVADELFPLFTSICIIYGRLFTQHGSRMLSLDKKSHVELSHYEIHDELMNARHRYIAHRNDESYEGFKAFLIVNPDDQSQFMVTHQSNRVAFNGTKKIQEIVDHIEAIAKRIKAKIESLRAKLVEEHKKKPLPIR